ncbi:MAG: hypothetical protein RL386_1047, partial [Bacteroidota bacterium]
ASFGEISDDGRFLAYSPIAFWDPEWRNYRGGQAQSSKGFLWRFAPNNNLGLCEKYFYGASRQIIFVWRHLFLDFAKQNQEKDVFIQSVFSRLRRQNIILRDTSF